MRENIKPPGRAFVTAVRSDHNFIFPGAIEIPNDCRGNKLPLDRRGPDGTIGFAQTKCRERPASVGDDNLEMHWPITTEWRAIMAEPKKFTLLAYIHKDLLASIPIDVANHRHV